MVMTRNCGRCGAPVPDFPQDEEPVTWPVSRLAARWHKALRALGWAVGVLVNVALLVLAIWCVIAAITDDGPTLDPNYIPPLAYAVWAVLSSIIPAVSAAIVVWQPVSRQVTRWDKAARGLALAVGVLVNVVVFTDAIWCVIAAITDDGPTLDPNYIPPLAYAICALLFSIIPAVSAATLVRLRRRRRVAASDSPGLPPQTRIDLKLGRKRNYLRVHR
jgi:hypothetical protein